MSLIVEGYDLSQLGFVLHKPGGKFDGQKVKWDTQKVPGRWGEVVTASEPAYPSETLDLTGSVVADDYATLRTNIDKIKSRIGRTERDFKFVDDAALIFRARCIDARFPTVHPALIQTVAEFRIKLLLVDPRKLGVFETITPITTDTALPLGTAPSRAEITVTGSGSFTLTYKDYAGATIYTMTIAGATPSVVIDMETFSITDSGGNAADKLTGGSFFAFDPEDGEFSFSQWPTLACSSGSASAWYQKAYL